MFFEIFGGQQAKLQVLGAAANGVAYFLRIGGSQHEHHVWWWLFQGLEQCSLCASTQHVHFVEDEYSVATGIAHRCTFDELTNVVDAIVACSVELEYVKTGATLDRQARVALAARLTLERIGAVEHLGQDACSRGLPRASWTRKHVRLTAAVVGNGITQGTNDVLLPFELGESARAIAAIQRLSGHFVASLPLG